MNATPSYIPSNTPADEVLAMLRDWLPLSVGYSVTAALEAEAEREREEANEEGYSSGYDAGLEAQEEELRGAIADAILALEAIPEDNGADASTDRAIAEALKALRTA